MNKLDLAVHPALALRAWVWALLKANYPEVWDESNYDGKTPIVPLSEAPELDNYSGPHIVYGYAGGFDNELPARGTGTTTFSVYDQNFRRLGRTMTILSEGLTRKDETARDVNEYLLKHEPFRGLRFGHVSGALMEGGEPETAEGGNQSALISVFYEYYADYNIKTTDL